MARRISVELVGNASSLERSFVHAGRSAKGFERDMNRTFRGVASGSGIFRGLGRSIAFASTGFLGAAGLTAAVRGSVTAAIDFGKASRGLDAQLRANNQSVAAAAPLLAKTNEQMARFGITSADSEVALTRLARATGDVRKAAGLMSLTANVAAARQISLAQASLLVGKVSQGMVTALNRGGLVIKKGTSVTDALRIATERFAGAGKAATTPLERLHAAVFNLEVGIGQALLPTIEKIADKLNAWISNAHNAQRVTDDVKEAVKLASVAFQGLRSAFDKLSGLAQAVGGWKTALELAAGAFVGFKLAGITAAAAVEVANIAAAAGTAAAWRAALVSTGIGALAVAAGTASAYIITHWQKVKGWFEAFWVSLRAGFKVVWAAIKIDAYQTALAVVEPFSHLPSFLGGWARSAKARLQSGLAEIRSQMRASVNKITDAWGQGGKDAATAWAKGVNKIVQPNGITVTVLPDTGKPLHPGKPGNIGAGIGSTPSPAAKKTPKGFTLPFRLQLAQAQADASGVQAAIVRVARQIRAFVLKLIPRLHGKKLLDAYSVLGQANSTIAAAVSAAAAKAKAAAEKASSFSVALSLQLAEAKATATGHGLAAVLKKIRAATYRAIRSHKLSMQGLIDAWNEIASINQQLASQAGSKGAIDTYHAVSTRAVTAGLGLSRDQRLILEERMAQRAAHRGYAPNGPAALGQGITITGPVTINGVENIDQLEKQLRKKARQRAASRTAGRR